MKTFYIFVASWLSSAALTYVHSEYCYPWFIGLEPCITLQETSLTLNRLQKNYLIFGASFVIEVVSYYASVFKRHSSRQVDDVGSSTTVTTRSSSTESLTAVKED